MKCAFSGKIEGIESEEKLDEVYIKKSDLLEKVVTEEMGDFVEREIVHLCDINKCATYTKQVSLEEVAEYCNDRNIEMVSRDWLDSLNDDLEKAVNIAKAYERSLKAFNGRLEELEHETELLNADLKDGVTGYGMQRKCFEVRIKKGLLRDIICFMEQAMIEERSAE